jgi:hypothetical protein
MPFKSSSQSSALGPGVAIVSGTINHDGHTKDVTMFSIDTLIQETAQFKNGRFNGVRAQLLNEEIPLEILLLLGARKNKKIK